MARPGDAGSTRREVRLSIEPHLEAVSRVTARLRPLLPAALGTDDAHAVELAIAEALTNIVEHGFSHQGGPDVLLHWRESEGLLEVEMTDAGNPIPAGLLERAGECTFDFDHTDIAGLPEGGMGLALIKAAFDGVEYRSDGVFNHLRLRKRLG